VRTSNDAKAQSSATLDDIPRPSVVEFAIAIEARLRENDHKGSWHHCSPGWLAGRCVQEIGELLISLTDEAPYTTIMAQAADVASFAMMIWNAVAGDHREH